MSEFICTRKKSFNFLSALVVQQEQCSTFPTFLVQFDWFHSMLQQLLANDQFNRNSAMSSLNSLNAVENSCDCLKFAHLQANSFRKDNCTHSPDITWEKTKKWNYFSPIHVHSIFFVVVFRYHFDPFEVQWCCDISGTTILQNQLWNTSVINWFILNRLNYDNWDNQLRSGS